MIPAIHPSTPIRRHGRIAKASVLAFTVLLAGGSAGGVAAHGPDPVLGGGLFGQNQDLRFRWRSGSEPTAAIKAALSSAALDVNASRRSRAATLTYDSAGANPIGYGLGATCGINGIACFTRSAPTGFTMWLREQGHVFDWGTLKWCQAYSVAPSGCYDAQTIGLDEFGHVEGLNHHYNFSDDSDYQDAVVQTYSRTKPSAGWSAHAFGACDIATLQLQYDMPTWTTKYSTCLALSTDLSLTMTRSANYITLKASLVVVSLTSYARLGGNPVSGRSVVLQRRAVGATTWSTVGAMAGGSASGTYTLTYGIVANTEFRAVFTTPADEGLRGDSSSTVLVLVGP